MITIDRIDTPNSKKEQRRKEQERRAHPIQSSNLRNREPDLIEEPKRFEQSSSCPSHRPNWLCRAWRLLTSSIDQNERMG